MAFAAKKAQILQSLSQSAEDYSDLSPKGSVDEPIRELINEINAYDDLVTTSSCSGRISVFLEGSGSGGKGSASSDSKKGSWLFVSHQPLPTRQDWHETFHLQRCEDEVQIVKSAGSPQRLIHIKFEPMILHIMCASAHAANELLKCAHQAGFRESGASNVPSSKSGEQQVVNVAVRTTGLAFDTLVGVYRTSDQAKAETSCYSLVSEAYLDTVVANANAKFQVNRERIERLRTLMQGAFGPHEGWEDAADRKERKRAEGLRRQQEMKQKQDGEGKEEAARDLEI